jgi:YihY family inner membrane protein
MELETDSSSLLILGIFFAILGASRLFIAIDRSFTIIYRLPERSMLRRNGMAMGMVLIFLIPFALLIAANLSSSLIVGGNQNISDRPGIYILGFLCSLLAAFILFEIIYLLIPNKKMSLKVTWCGALIASFLFEIVIIWFPLYAQTNTKSYTGK